MQQAKSRVGVVGTEVNSKKDCRFSQPSMRNQMDNVHIRKCGSRDTDEICLMQEHWAEVNITYGYVPSHREEFINRLGAYFFVAEVNERLVGFVYGLLHVSKGSAVIPAGQQYLEVDEIYVTPEFRGHHVGEALFDKAMQAAQTNGIERSLVYSATKDLDKILGFYRRHGFGSCYVQMLK